MLVISSGSVSGQEVNLMPAQFPMEDTLHFAVSDSLSLVAGDTAVAAVDTLARVPTEAAPDSMVALRDSVPKTVIVGLSDPLDTVSDRIFAYQVLDGNSYARTRVVIDTMLSRFEINNPVMKYYHVGAYLGNAGLSSYPVGFEARRRPSDFPFTDHVSLYMHLPEETKYYQTQMPYTLIDYSSAGSKSQNESMLSVVHTQNVNKKWNAGLDYDIIASVGQYPNQNTSDHAFSLFSAYRGSQYSMFASFNWNNIRMRENGGLDNIDNFYAHNDAPQTNSVRSQSGKTVMTNRSFYMMHTYSPRQLKFFEKEAAVSDSVSVSRFTLAHTLKYEWSKREFTDNATYFRAGNPYFATTDTHDSLYFRRMQNHFELMIKEQIRKRFTAGFSIGLLNEMDRYDNNIIPDTTIVAIPPHVPPANGWGGDIPPVSSDNFIITRRSEKRYFNTALTGRFFNHTGRYLNWDFSGRLYFTGYKPGNLNISGTVQFHYYTSKGKNSLLLGGSMENAKPGYFLNEYASNWLSWRNDFDASQEIRLRGEFMMPHRKLKAGVYLSQLNRYVYINSQAVPEQSSDLIVVSTVFVEKDVKWWKLNFLFRLYGQYSSHDRIIPLPVFAGYQSAYFEGWLVRDVLTMQLGWDFNYNTRYHAYAYMPSSGMFYLQEEQKTGGYPFFDAFVNFQIKRARIFVKTEGLNTLVKPLGKEYFMVYRYPLPEFRIKFGVSWAFYD
ncbi:MAG: putative porin [Bacteroidales bacterium]|nr:putative porin [Bacteroidales bacterium]